MTFTTADDLGRDHVKDGTICIWKNWVTLTNAKGAGIIGRHLMDDEVISLGSEVIFPSHVATVGRCMISPTGDHSLVWSENSAKSVAVSSVSDS